MTRFALKKILIFVLAFAACVVIALTIQAAMNSGHGDDENSTEPRGTKLANDGQIIASITNNDSSPAELAKDCFNFTLDTSIPQEIVDETLDPADFEEAYASDSCWSYLFEGGQQEAAAHCKDALESKGWVAQEGNSEVLASFAKASGNYHWIVVQYLAQGEKCIVLVSPIET